MRSATGGLVNSMQWKLSKPGNDVFTFFSGWRRKFGVVTLFLACLFTAGWVRGHGIKDVYQFGNGEGKVFQTLVSSHHGMMWIRSEVFGGSSINWNPGWFAYPIDSTAVLHSDESRIVCEIKSRWKWCGFDFCESWDKDKYRSNHRNIPYWSIVVPLTLLSAFLLLSKPLQSTPKRAIVRIPEKAA